MSEQRRLPSNMLTEEFNEKKRDFLSSARGNKVAPLISDLSSAISQLRDIGVDVQLQLSGSSGIEHFQLVESLSGCDSVTIFVSGLLKIDTSERLLAICIKEDGTSVLKLYVSLRDAKGRNLENDLRGEVFDMNPNHDAYGIVKLQKWIMKESAENAVIEDLDTDKVINEEYLPEPGGKTGMVLPGFKPHKRAEP